MKRLIALAAALILLLLPIAALAGSPGESTQSIARVYVLTNTKYDSIGSAIAVGKRGEKVEYFITNKHVVANRVGVFLCLGDAMSMLHASVVQSWDVPDLAVLKLDKPSTEWQPITIKPTSHVKVSERIYTLSFPSGADMSYSLKSSADDVTVTEGVISSKDVDVEGFKCLRISANISGGSSGGAVVTEDGAAVGVCVGGVDAGYNYAINSDYVITALNSLGISYIAGGDNSTLLIIIIAAVALIAVGVALFLLLRKPRRAVPQYGYTITDANDDTPYTPNVAAPINGGRLPGGVGLNVICIEGPMKGRSYPIGDLLILGRDPSCGVVFPSNTPGVSGRHCSIAAEGKFATLTDLRSSCGTFLNDGTRLTGGASYSLQRGDTFYLGSKSNGFMLE